VAGETIAAAELAGQIGVDMRLLIAQRDLLKSADRGVRTAPRDADRNGN
jgi:hypothetical protein